jgi:hypothetical protein
MSAHNQVLIDNGDSSVFPILSQYFANAVEGHRTLQVQHTLIHSWISVVPIYKLLNSPVHAGLRPIWKELHSPRQFTETLTKYTQRVETRLGVPRQNTDLLSNQLIRLCTQFGLFGVKLVRCYAC